MRQATRWIACFFALFAMTIQASHSIAHPHIHTPMGGDHAAHHIHEPGSAADSGVHNDCEGGGSTTAGSAPACGFDADDAQTGGADYERLDCCAGHCCAAGIARAGGADLLILAYPAKIGVLTHDQSFTGALAHPPRRPPKRL